MSSFIVSDKTVNRIVTCLDSCKFKEDCISSDINQILNKNKISLKKLKDLQKLKNRLFSLNYEAVNYRYDINQEVKISPFKYEQSSEIQVLKSLECLRYQCLEGNIPKKPLYKMISQVIEILRSHIINKIPEYQEAEWN